MAKTKSTSPKRATKKAVRKKTAKSATVASDSMLPPRKRAIVQRKLKRIGTRPSYPSEAVGPVLPLSFDAPIKRTRPKTKRKPARKRKTR